VRWRWVAIGALAVLGTFWLFLRLMFALEIWDEWVPFVGNAIAGAAAGAMIARHAEIKPWREPIIAAIVALGIVFAFWFAFPHVVNDRPPTTRALIGMAATVVSALGGAAFVRRYFATTPSFAVTALLNAQILGGLMMLTLALVAGLGASKGVFTGLMMLGIVVAAALTQWVTPMRRAFACSAGGLVMVAIIMSGDGSDKASAIAGFMVLWIVGAIGAAVQWKLSRRTELTASVPPAKLQ
jgi:hypothetical protein